MTGPEGDNSPAPLICERHGAVCVLTLNRPGQRNALDQSLREELARAIPEIRNDETIRAVVITGAGGAFCAGGDLRAMSERRRTARESRRNLRNIHVWFRELVNLEKPVIAAVAGPAFGAGMNLALAADFIVASENASFCAAFGRVGLVPDLGGLFLLPRIVGLQRAKEIVFSARILPAVEARELGIVYEVCREDALMDQAMTLADRFTSASTEAIGMAKSILNQSFNLDQHALAEMEAYAQAIAMTSDYHSEAVSRFLARQAPAFSWPRPTPE